MENPIFLGDCFDLLKNIDNNKVDLILTDPPYDISKTSNFSKSDIKRFNTMKHDFGEWDKSIDLITLFTEFKRVLRKGGTLIIFYDIWKCNQIKEAAIEVGFRQPRIGQWVKNNPPPINSKWNYLTNGIEYFFTFCKGDKITFNSKYDNGIYHHSLVHGKERFHPTQKPLKLIEELVLKHSNEGDFVLDPFAGSGVTGEACQNLNRRYCLIEREEEYYEKIKIRLNDKDKELPN